MYKFVFFDLDGTVLDTIEDLAGAGNAVLGEFGFPGYETDRYKYFVGNGIPKLIERIFPPDSPRELLDRAYAMFTEYYRAHCEDKTRPYDGMPELIDALNAKGIRCAVITNKDNAAAQKLIKHFYGERIAAVYGSIAGKPRKPDPYWVNEALKAFGADKSEVLYVGDSGVDMQTAKNAGLTGCGVLWGFRSREELAENGAVYICGKPEEILGVISNKE